MTVQRTYLARLLSLIATLAVGLSLCACSSPASPTDGLQPDTAQAQDSPSDAQDEPHTFASELAAVYTDIPGADDMIWTWWYYPQVISYSTPLGGRVIWGFATSEGECGIARLDQSTGVVSKSLFRRSEPDDHVGLALTLLPDNRIMVAYSSGHNDTNEMYVRISDRPDDISDFSGEIVLECSGKTCYAQILTYDDTFYLFYRLSNKKWAYRSSPDGLSWSDETVLITADMQYYCRFIPTTEAGLVRIVMYSNPSKDDPAIRMGFLQLSNGQVYNADLSVALGTRKIPATEFTELIPIPEEGTQRFFDVAITEPSKILLLYCTFTYKKHSDDSIYKLYDSSDYGETSSVTVLGPGGKALWDPKYQLGGSFIGSDSFVLAREYDGYDHIELYSYDGEHVTLQDTIFEEPIGATSDNRNGRPITDINGHVILWHRGLYDPASYTYFNTKATLAVLN